MSLDVFSAKRQESLVRLDPRATAVLTVDMLNEFCKPGGAMVLPGYEALVEPQRRVIAAARAAGATVVWVVDAHRPNMRHERELAKRTPHCLEGGWGARVIDDLGARSDEIFVTKRRYSAFFNTDLDVTLKDMQVQALVVMGVVTNICVRSTVHDAFFHGYTVVVPEDCVAATGPREQASSLYDIATHFGTVSTSREVEAALSRGAPLVNREMAA
jgi:ureidoacrylate peracid hydrolase